MASDESVEVDEESTQPSRTQLSRTTAGDEDGLEPLREMPLPLLYADPQMYDLMAQMTAPKDLAFYQRLVDERGGPVLELGCGTGRLTIPLAARVEMWALDIVEPMVMTVKAKAEALPSRPEKLALAHGDMRDFELDQRFSTVIMPYNTFNHLQSLGDALRCLRSVRKHLQEDGRLVIDTFHPDPKRLQVGGGEEERLFRYREPETQKIVQFFETSDYDPVRQVNQARWRWATEAGETLREDHVSMRLFFPAELEAILRLGGFVLEERWGTYDRQPFEASASKQLCLCRPLRD